MAYPQSLREKMGVSQAVFANLIGCSESVLSMVEIGQRQLSTASLAMVLLFEQTLAQVNVNHLDTEPLAIDVKPLQKLLAKLQLQLNNKQQQLTKLHEKIKQCQQLQQMHVVLGEAAFEQDSVNALQWNILQRKTTKHLQQASANRVNLYIAIAALQAQIATIESFM